MSGSSTTGTVAANTAVTGTITAAGTNRLLICAVSLRLTAGESVKAISDSSGHSLTWVFVNGVTNTTNSQQREEIWATFDPGTFSGTVTVTLQTGNSIKFAAVVSAYSGTKTTEATAIGATGTNQATSQNPNAAVTTTAANSLVIMGMGARGTGTYTAVAGQTNNATNATSGGAGTGNTLATQTRQNAVTGSAGTSVTMGATSGNNLSASEDWTVVAVELIDSAAVAAAYTPRALLMMGIGCWILAFLLIFLVH